MQLFLQLHKSLAKMIRKNEMRQSSRQFYVPSKPARKPRTISKHIYVNKRVIVRSQLNSHFAFQSTSMFVELGFSDALTHCGSRADSAGARLE